MGRFKGLSNVSTGNTYFQGNGSYVVELGDIIFKQNRQRIDSFIVETLIIESDNNAYRPGQTPSQVISFKHDAAPRNVKGFAAAVLEIESPDDFVPEEAQQLTGDARQAAIDKWWDDAVEFLVSESQPAKGFRIRLVTENIKTEAGGNFTLHKWGQVVQKPAA